MSIVCIMKMEVFVQMCCIDYWAWNGFHILSIQFNVFQTQGFLVCVRTIVPSIWESACKLLGRAEM
jgi:hypothetical protein